jgi:ubiquitin carboxyl-terminal hydrolase 14
MKLIFTAIVTHKGAAADAGHYIGFVKKSVFHPAKPPPPAPTADGASPPVAPPPPPMVEEENEDWYKFDDDRVSDFPVEKLATLDGGGKCLFFFGFDVIES